MNALRVPLRVVFYEEEGEWIAHCLEFRENWDAPQSVPGDLVSA